jgi:hypothetical protein
MAMNSTPPPGFGPRWGAAGPSDGTPAPRQEGAAPGGPEDPGPAPMPRRLLQAAALLGLVLIAVIVLSSLHRDENPFNPIALAAERTQSSPGYEASVQVTYTSADLPAPVVADGSVETNSESGLARATLEVPSPAGSTISVESLGDESHVYVRSGAFAGKLPDGAEWIGFEPFLGESAPSLAASDGGANSLELLRGVSDDVEALGRDEVDGTLADRYRASIDLGHLADLLDEEGGGALAEQYRKIDGLTVGPVEVEAWVSKAGMVRRERVVTTTAPEDGGAALTVDLLMTIEKVGVKPQIQLPDPSRVYDATPLFRKELEGLDG